MKQPVKVHVIVEQGGIQLAEMVTEVSGGRHEFSFLTPVRVPVEGTSQTRHFEGFALEMRIDQDMRRVVYNEHIAHRPKLDIVR